LQNKCAITILYWHIFEWVTYQLSSLMYIDIHVPDMFFYSLITFFNDHFNMCGIGALNTECVFIFFFTANKILEGKHWSHFVDWILVCMHLMLPVCMHLEKDFTHVIFTIVKMCTTCFLRVLCPGTLCQSGVGVINCHIVLQSATFYVCYAQI